MSDESGRGRDAGERASEIREHHEEAQEHNPDERAPEERSGVQDVTEEGLLSGVPGQAANRPTG
jgi:hypothetical protein